MTTTTIELNSPSALAEIVRTAVLTGTRNFSVVNVKKDGTAREWIINPKGGRAMIKGTGPIVHLAANLLKVFDVTASQGRDEKGRFRKTIANGWRTLNLDTIHYAKIDGVGYRVKNAWQPLPLSKI